MLLLRLLAVLTLRCLRSGAVRPAPTFATPPPACEARVYGDANLPFRDGKFGRSQIVYRGTPTPYP